VEYYAFCSVAGAGKFPLLAIKKRGTTVLVVGSWGKTLGCPSATGAQKGHVELLPFDWGGGGGGP